MQPIITIFVETLKFKRAVFIWN